MSKKPPRLWSTQVALPPMLVLIVANARAAARPVLTHPRLTCAVAAAGATGLAADDINAGASDEVVEAVETVENVEDIEDDDENSAQDDASPKLIVRLVEV